MRESLSKWLCVGLVLTGGLGMAAARGAAPVQAATVGTAYHPVTPSRILDTRVDGGALGPGANLNLQVTGIAGVPADATAVVLNVTATDTTAQGYLTVYPAGGAPPLASNLNWTAGQTVANLAVVQVSSAGAITIHNASGSVQVVVDLQGYFAPLDSGPGYYVPLTPARIADTRPDSGLPYAGQTLGPRTALGVQVAGVDGVPAAGAVAAVLQVTVTNTTAAGFASVYPDGIGWPGTSTVNWRQGQTVAARVIVPLGSGGQVMVYNQVGWANVIVDVTGYFTESAAAPGASLYYPAAPFRMLDTRADGGTLGAQQSLLEQLAGVGPVASQASAVVANLTATDTSAASFLAATPGISPPTTSDLNWGAGATVATLDIATLSSAGDLALYNGVGEAQLVIDVSGYFVPSSAYLVPSSGTATVPLACTDPTVSVTNSPTSGGQIHVSAAAECPSGTSPTYTVWYQTPGSAVWRFSAASSSSSSFSYTSGTGVVGTYRFVVWASSQAGAFQGAAAATAVNLTTNPSANLPDSYAATCYDQGYSSSACVSSALAAISAAQVDEGVPGLALPSDFSTLSQPIQAFVLADAERVSRGLPAIPGLTPAADANAQQAAAASNDPNGLAVSGAINFVSVWAGDYGATGAMFDWMYNDGLDSSNEDCTASGQAGCWAHRENILLNTAPGGSAAPSGYTWVGGAACAAISGITYFNSCTLEWVLVPTSSVSYQYTWAQAVAAGA